MITQFAPLPHPKMPETNPLASKATQILDDLLNLASTKNPINLDPLQITYDLANGVYKKCETLMSPIASTISKGRDSIVGLFN
jgi:hypothetical protein